ncbi:MAG TPA: hypothetical protein VGF36_03715, partial [Rhodopila sp.]
PPFAGANDLDLAVRHRFKVDLKVSFKVSASAYFAKPKQGGDHRTLTSEPWRDEQVRLRRPQLQQPQINGT